MLHPVNARPPGGVERCGALLHSMPATRPLPALTLCAFRAGSLSGGTEVSAPSRLLVLPMGRHDARDRGPVICSAVTISGFAAAQASAKLGTRLALDFEHNTVPGTPAFLAEKEPKAIAAWADATPTSFGVEYHNIEWTPAGLEAWKNKAFQDISPAVFRQADGTVIALHSAALCRHGELDGLTIEAASAPASLAPLFAALSASTDFTDYTDSKPPMKPTPALITLLAALSVTLAADADEAATEAALLEGAKAIDGMIKKPDAMTAATPEIIALTARLTAMEAAETERKRAALMAAAAAAGKVVPLSAELLKVTPLNVLEGIIAATKATVPLTRTTPTVEPLGDKPEAFSAESVANFAKFGLSAEDVAANEKLRAPQTAAA